MVRYGLLLSTACVLLLTAAGLPMASASEATECTQAMRLAGKCPAPVIEVTHDPDGVTIGGSVEVPGSSDGGGSGGGNGGTGTPASPVAEPPAVFRDGYTVTPPLSVSELVNFRPTPGTDHMQPNGWMVVGLDTNFYARAMRQVKTGELFGLPASVRFTPARYRWSYGDGTTTTTGTPGATWGALGVHEFDATPTSHIYRDTGTYYIDLTIGFSPEYRYASGAEWIPVPGLVWVPANRLLATAGGPKTVLVEDACTVNPLGPGC